VGAGAAEVTVVKGGLADVVAEALEGTEEDEGEEEQPPIIKLAAKRTTIIRTKHFLMDNSS